MIFVIMSYGVHRNQEGRHWSGKAVAYSVGAAIAGVALGAILGFLGSGLSSSARLGLVALVGFVAIAAGIVALPPFEMSPPQLDRETDQRWMNRGAWRGAVLNGLALGAGFTTRIGFWLWYLIPVAAFLSGSAWHGAIVYGTYALARGLAPWALIVAAAWDRAPGLDVERVGDWLAARRYRIRVLAAAEVAAIGIALVIVGGP